jgi:purine catabolism regulator
MTVLCQDILHLGSLKKAELIGGINGLDRVVRWIHVIDIPDVSKWVHEGDIVATTCINLNTEIINWEEYIEQLNSKKLAGLIINIGPYIPYVPEVVKKMADEMNFPVFTLPWEVKLADVTREVSKILVKDQLAEDSISDFDSFLQYIASESKPLTGKNIENSNAKKVHQVVVFKIVNWSLGAASHIGSKEVDLGYAKLLLQRLIQDIAAQHRPPLSAKLMLGEDDVIAIITHVNNSEIDLFISNIVDRIVKSGVEIQVGIGGNYADMKELRKSYDQAEFSLKCAIVLKNPKNIFAYKKLGILRLVFDGRDYRELEEYYQETLSQLVEYDRNFESNLVESVRIFLDENGNGIKAAKKLYVHRNTLRYRIQRAEEILGLNFANGEDRLSVQAALLIGKVLKL